MLLHYCLNQSSELGKTMRTSSFGLVGGGGVVLGDGGKGAAR